MRNILKMSGVAILVSIIFALPQVTQAAISLVDGVNILSSSSNTTSYTSSSYAPTSDNNVLVFIVHGYKDTTGTSNAINTVTWGGSDISTNEVVFRGNSTRDWKRIFVVTSPGTTGQTFSITMSGNHRGMAVDIFEFSGVDTASPTVSTTTDGGNGNNTTLTFSVSTTGNVLVGGVNTDGGNEGPFTPLYGSIEVTDGGTGGTDFNDTDYSSFYVFSTSTGSVNIGTSWASNEDFSTAGVELNVDVGGSLSFGSFAGTLYASDGITPITSQPTVKLVIGTSTPSATTTVVAADGTYSFTGISTTSISIDTPIVAFVDASTTLRAAVVSKVATTSNGVGGLDLYQDAVIVKQEGATSTDLSDLAVFDSTDDNDLQYTASSTLDSLNILNSQTLHIWSGDTFVGAASTTLTGSYVNNGTYTHNNGTLHLAGTSTTLSGILTGTSALGDLEVSGDYEFLTAAEVGDLTISSGATTTASTTLTITGNYSNSGIFEAGSYTVVFDGTNVQTATGTITGSSAFHHLTISNTSQNGTTSRSVIFGAAASTTGTFTLTASSSVGLLAGATSSFAAVSWVGTTTTPSPVWIYSSATGTPSYVVVSGTATIEEAYLRDINACGSTGGEIVAYLSIDVGGNSCVTFGTPTVTLSGTLYSDEGSTEITSGKTIKLLLATSTQSIYSTTTDSGTGTFQFTVEDTYLPTLLEYLVIWVDGDATTPANLFYKTGATSTDMASLNLYKDHVIVREATGDITNAVSAADLSLYDSSDDGDLKYTASSTANTVLIVEAGNELYLWTDTTLALGGNAITHGNAGSGNDGSLELAEGASLRMASGTLSIAGNLVISTSSKLVAPSDGLIFTATTTGKTIAVEMATTTGYANIADVTFNGAGGGWTWTRSATTSALSIIAGAVTVASGQTLTVQGDFTNNGTFTNNGELILGPGEGFDMDTATFSNETSVTGNQSIQFSADGSKLYVADTAGKIREYPLSTPWDYSTRGTPVVLDISTPTSPWNLLITPDGRTLYVTDHDDPIYIYSMSTPWDISTANYTNVSVNLPEVVVMRLMRFSPDGQKLYIGDSNVHTYDLAVPWEISLTSATYSHQYNFIAQENQVHGVEFNPAGTKIYVTGREGDDVNVYALSTPWLISTSSVTYLNTPLTLTTLEPRDSAISPDGTKYFVSPNSSSVISTYTLEETPQIIAGTLTGTSALGDLTISNASTTTFSNNASTTDLIINGTTSAPAKLTVNGHYTNNNVFTANNGEVFLAGTNQQTATGTLSGTSAFYDLTITNISQNGTTSQSVIFGAAASTTGTFTMLASTSAQFLANATNTFQNLSINGSSNVSEAWLRSSNNGTQWYLAVPGTADVNYANLRDSNVCGSAGGGLTATSSTDTGNNSCWTIIPVVVGSSTITNHDTGQVSNAFNFQNKIDETLFAFKLTPESGNATVTDASFTLTGVQKINVNNFSNIRLYRDNNSDAAYDELDIQVGGTGVMTTNGQTGSITFTGDFLSTTSQNYILVADWSAPVNGTFMVLSLPTNGLTVIDDIGVQTVFGSVDPIQHSRNNRGGGGSSASIGNLPPAGNGNVGGGTNEGGELIGNNPNFYWPTANSGSWTTAGNAYDQADGTYATDNAGATNNFSSHAFGIPSGNTIKGIEIKLEISGTTAAGNIGIELSWDNGSSWTSSKNTPTLTTTDAVVSVGGPSDLWGRSSWSVSELSDANFIVRLTGNPSSNTVQVDAIQVRVYHQTSGGGSGGGGAI